MKKLLSLAALGLALSFGAASGAMAATAQQEKMKTCNADAKTKALKGDERKSFMKECLGTSKGEKQRNKMKTCNADAKTKALKGDARKSFMKECLSAA